MIINVLLLIIGVLLLIKGSDVFVDSASSIAKKMGVSDFLIGLTLVAVGTSIPELASSIKASLEGYSGIIIGNIVGSNIANIGIILGVTIILKELVTNKDVLKRDGYILFGVSVLFYLLALDGVLNWVDGLVLLLIYTAYIAFLIKSKNELKQYHFREFVKYFFEFQYVLTIKDEIVKQVMRKPESAEIPPSKKKIVEVFKEGIIKDILFIIIGLAGVIIGANYFVEEAVFFADLFSIPRVIIGITIVAIGTSLPELSVSISAAKKNFGDMSVGNVLGSNISNLLLILGVCSLINPVIIGQTTISYAGPFMLILTFLLLIFINSEEKLIRREGVMLLILYLLFIIALSATGLIN